MPNPSPCPRASAQNVGDMEQARGRIITFYSYKGGAGRTMALANFAWILAANGRHVLAIDWDLEAPGLHRYFRPFLVDPDLFETDGLIDTFWSLAAWALTSASTGQTRYVPADSNQIAAALEDATRRLDCKFSTRGYIDFIGAGRQDGTYSERVNTFDWKRFYELGGARMLTTAKAHLRASYHWILIDSRTGVSDTSGICTMQMPDVLVPCFTLNRQSTDGAAAILQSIRAFHSASVNGSSIEFFPLATRIENAEQERLEVARGYARAALADFLPTAMQKRPREYWDTMEIAYRPAYAFEEVLAAFGDATGAAGAKDTMLSQVEAMAQRIAGDDTLRVPEILEADRRDVLGKYAFGALTTEGRVGRAADDAAADNEFLRGVRAKEQLWRGSGFQSSLLLSRRELDILTDEDRKGFGRNMAFYLNQSERMHQLFRTVQLGALFTVLLALAAVLTLAAVGELFRPSWWLYLRDTWGLPGALILVYGFMAVWTLSALAFSVVAAWHAPYGVRPFEVWMLWLRFLTRPEIRDYNPDEEATPSPPARR